MKRSMNKNLPNLKIVSLSKLVVHEEVDPARTRRLLKKIKKDNFFTNPPLVAPIKNSGKFVVLDGANRTGVFTKLGFKDILVQIVDYKSDKVKLKTWNHLVCKLDSKKVKKLVDQTIPKGFRLKGSQLICPAIKEKDFLSQIKALNKIVNLYKNKYKFYRLTEDDNPTSFCQQGYTLIVFPGFKPKDIMLIAQKGIKIPSGITRHVILDRALLIDLPMSILKAKKPLSWKNQKLRVLINQRLRENKLRHYQEPVFIYND